MAVAFIAAVWQISPYSAEKLLVQLALADWSNDAGDCYPSHAEIAHKARISKRGSILIIQQMIEDKELEKVQSGDGRGNRNRYRFAQKYREAVAQISQEWQDKRSIKGEPASPFGAKKGERASPFPIKGEPASPFSPSKGEPDAPFIVTKGEPASPFELENSALPQMQKVNEKAERVNETVKHIRKNRHEPSCIKANTNTKEKKIKKEKKESHTRNAILIFDHWKTVMDSPRSILGDKRRNLIIARLEEGHSVEDLMEAIDGCRASPYHMGQEPGHPTIYNSIELILRDAGKVDQFKNYLTNRNNNGTSHRSAPPKKYCGACITGWIPPEAKGGYAKRCACNPGGVSTNESSRARETFAH